MRLISRCWALALFVGLSAFSVSSARADDPLKYLGKDTEAIVSINLRQILESKLADDYAVFINQAKEAMKVMLENNADMQKFQKALDFDPFTDLNSLTWASPGKNIKEEFLMIIDGKFKTKKFEQTATMAQLAKPQEIKVHRVLGKHNLYEYILPDQEGKSAFICMVNSSTVLIGTSKKQVANSILQASNREKARMSPAVQKLLKTAGTKQSFTMLSTSDAFLNSMKENNAPNIQAAETQLAKINGMTATAKVSKDIRFEFGLEAKNEDTAKEFTQSLALGLFGLKGMIAQRAQQDPRMLMVQDIVKTLNINPQGTTVLINGRISAKVIEEAVNKLKNLDNGL